MVKEVNWTGNVRKDEDLKKPKSKNTKEDKE